MYRNEVAGRRRGGFFRYFRRNVRKSGLARQHYEGLDKSSITRAMGELLFGVGRADEERTCERAFDSRHEEIATLSEMRSIDSLSLDTSGHRHDRRLEGCLTHEQSR